MAGRRASPTEYSDELAKKLCDEIAIGTSVANACKEIGVAESSFFRWLYQHEYLREHYARAKDAAQDQALERIIQLADAATPETERVVRLQIDARKWAASKLAPKRFGDRTALDVTVKDERDDAELMHELKQLAERQGIDPASLIPKGE